MSANPRPRNAWLAGLVDWFGFTNAELLRVLPVGVVGAVAGAYGAAHLLPPWAAPRTQLLIVLVGAMAGFVLCVLVVRLVVQGSARVVAGSVMPSGHTTPSQADYSREDALLMQRDVRGALESFEAKIAADPLLVGARVHAADLYAREGNDPARAEALFREVQRIRGVAQADDLYVSNRLVDLYDGPLANPGRAMVELRRIIDRFGGTRAAADARRGLATIKARHQADGAADRGGRPD